jgi:hypothetical protein
MRDLTFNGENFPDRTGSLTRYGTFSTDIKPSPLNNGSNLLSNSGFENWTDGVTPDGWGITSNGGTTKRITSTYHGGTTAIGFLQDSSNTYQSVYQTVILQNNTDYQLSFWNRTSSGGTQQVGAFFVNLENLTYIGSTSYQWTGTTNWWWVTSGTTWSQFVVKFKTTTGTNAGNYGTHRLYLQRGGNCNYGTGYFDDAVLCQLNIGNTLDGTYQQRILENVSRAKGLAGTITLQLNATTSVPFPFLYFNNPPIVRGHVLETIRWKRESNWWAKEGAIQKDFFFPTGMYGANLNMIEGLIGGLRVKICNITCGSFSLIYTSASESEFGGGLLIPSPNNPPSTINVYWHAFGL